MTVYLPETMEEEMLRNRDSEVPSNEIAVDRPMEQVTANSESKPSERLTPRLDGSASPTGYFSKQPKYQTAFRRDAVARQIKPTKSMAAEVGSGIAGPAPAT